ncbi:SCP2 sterol-binding domain-containing protein [Rhodomicrobium vannielii]|nr:SCP2 sterol-binding domain-containing protein [Rhodomicrobium vannielii]
MMDLNEVADALTKRVGSKSPLGGSVKFDLGEAGCLYIDGTGAANTVAVDKNDPAKCTISMSAGDFSDLIHGRLQPTSAFMQGKMRVDGDMGLAMKLGQIV